MNPRQMQAAMKKMGIQQVEIPAIEVIIKTADKDIYVLNPSVLKVNMMGQETLQISGQLREQKKIVSAPEISEEDIKTVMEQAKVNREQAHKALKETDGDLAEAIMKLTQTEE